MRNSWWRKLVGAFGFSSSRKRYPIVRTRLRLEQLEDRLVPAVLTWEGDVGLNWNDGTAGVDTNWISAGDQVLPADGDTLQFTATGNAAGVKNNNTTAGNSYILDFSAIGYDIVGNDIALDLAGDDVTDTSGFTTLALPFILDANSTFNITSGILEYQSSLSGAGGSLTKNGGGVLGLGGVNSYDGLTNVNGGVLVLFNGGSINSANPVTIAAGAIIAASNGGGAFNAPISGAAGSTISTNPATSLSLGNATANGFVTAGTVDLRAGSTITLVDSDTAELGASTVLSSGSTLIAANGVALSAGDVLSGNGTVQAAITLGAGTISPGASAGDINVTGDVDFTGGRYAVEIDGNTAGTFDTLDITGSATLGGATLDLSGSGYTPVSGNSFVILTTTGGITGTFKDTSGNDLIEGAAVFVNGQPLSISYAGGNVTLSYDATPVIFTGAGSNDVIVRLDAGGNLEVVIDTVTVIDTAPANITNLTLNTDAGDDQVTVDFTNGNPIPVGGLTYNGGNDAGDNLVLAGGVWTTNTYNYTNANDGSVNLDGSVIQYTGLAPISNSGIVTDIIFNLPAGGTDLVLEDDGTPGNGISQIRNTGGVGFETTTFLNPTSSLTVNGGTGNDTITVSSAVGSAFDNGPAAGQFNASLVLDGLLGDDVATINQALDLAGSVTVAAETINLASNVTTTGAQTYTGAITLLASIALTAGNDLNLQGAVTGGGFDLTLDASNVAGSDISGTSVSGVGTLTITQSDSTTFTGAVGATTVTLTDTNIAVTFQGNLIATTLNTAAQGYSVVLQGASNTITNAVTFSNTGGVTLGNGGDITLFAGGVTSTAGTTTINGAVRTSGDAATFGAVTLAGNSTIDTTNNGANAGGNDITLGAVTGGGFDLTLNAGNGAGSDISGTSVSGVGTLTITQSDSTTFTGALSATTVTLNDTNNAITFQDSLTATTLNIAAQGYSVILQGSSNTITNAVTFSNTGGVTLGNGGDIALFAGGVSSTASTTTINGTVRTSGDTVTFGTTTIAGASSIDTTNAGASPAGGSVTLGATTATPTTATLTIDAGTGGGVTLYAQVTVQSFTVSNSGTISAQGISTTAGTSGPISLTAQNGITLNGPLDAGSSTVSVSANQDGAGSESLSMAAGSSITTTNTSATGIDLRVNTAGGGAGNAALASLQTGATGTIQVDVTATGAGGAITDSNGATNNLNTRNLVLMAATGIGTGAGTAFTGGELEATVSNVDISNATSGGVYLRNTGALTIVDSALDGDALGLVAAGGGRIEAASPLTISSNSTIGASMTLVAGDSAVNDDDLTINSGAVITLDSAAPLTLTLQAGDDILFNTGSITSGQGVGPYTVNLNADNEGAGGGDTDRGRVTQTDATTSVTANTLNITGPEGIGTSAVLPFRFNADTLTTNSTGLAAPANQFLFEGDTVTATSINASTAGVTLVNGVFKIGTVGGAISDNTDVTVNSPAVLDLNGNNETIDALLGDGSVTNSLAASTGTLTVGNNNAAMPSFTGVISDGSATAITALTKIGAGTQILTNTNTYTGTTNINGGTLRVTGTLSTSTTSLVNLNSAVTLDGAGTGQILRPVVVTATGSAAQITNLTVNTSSSTTDGITIQAGANNVTVSSVTSTGNQNGINVAASGGLQLTNVTATSNALDGVHAINLTATTTIDGGTFGTTGLGNGGDGLDLTGDNLAGTNLVMLGNGTATDNSGNGLLALNFPGVLAITAGVRITGWSFNENGIDGIHLDTVADFLIDNVIAARNDSNEGLDAVNLIGINNRITRSVFEANDRGIHLGAVVAAQTDITDTSIRSNSGAGDGAGILVTGGSLTMDTSTRVHDNITTAGSGGGVAFLSTGTLAIQTATTFIRANTAAQDGGGLFIDNALATVIIRTDAEISGNRAADDGGGIFVASAALVTIDDAHIGTAGFGNVADFGDATDADDAGNGGDGGGIFAAGGFVTIQNGTTIQNNLADNGGGINVAGGTVTFLQVLAPVAPFFNATPAATVSDNTAANAGGGLNVSAGTLVMDVTTVANNSATAGSGGGLNVITGNITINNSTFSGNTATTSGGGIAFFGTTATLRNVTASGNTAVTGGGMAVIGGSVILENDTFARNTGGGVARTGGTVVSTNSLFAENTGADYTGTIASGGFNLFQNITSLTGIAATDLLNQAARLAPLANYGGPTETHALLPGSAALDRGTILGPVPNDQRGVVRPVAGPYDIGAYESRGFSITRTGVPIQTAPTLAAGGTLSIGVPVFYIVTTVIGANEVTVSNEQTITPNAGNQSVNLSWIAATGATGYKIYRASTSGDYTDKLIAAVGAGVTNFTDTGLATSVGTPPETTVRETPFGDNKYRGLIDTTFRKSDGAANLIFDANVVSLDGLADLTGGALLFVTPNAAGAATASAAAAFGADAVAPAAAAVVSDPVNFKSTTVLLTNSGSNVFSNTFRAQAIVTAGSIESGVGTSYFLFASAGTLASTYFVGGANNTDWRLFNQEVTSLSFSAQPQNTTKTLTGTSPTPPTPIQFVPAGTTTLSPTFGVTMQDQEQHIVRVANLPVSVQSYLGDGRFFDFTTVGADTIKFATKHNFSTGQALIYASGRSNANPNTPGPNITGATQTEYTFAPADVNLGTSEINFAAPHGLTTGQALVYDNGGGLNINALADGVIYYAIATSPTALKLALTPADALAATAIPLGSAGTATQILTPRYFARVLDAFTIKLAINPTNANNPAGPFLTYPVVKGGTSQSLVTDPTTFSAGAVNTVAKTITFAAKHGFVTGTALAYSNGTGALITGAARTTFLFSPAAVNTALAARTITFAAPHGLTTGQAVTYQNGGGTSIGGLVNSLTYYVINVNATTIKLALTPQKATAGAAILLTSAGTATQSLTPTYYAIRVNDFTIKLAINPANATAGVALTPTSTGGAGQSLVPTGKINSAVANGLSAANLASGAINTGATIALTQAGAAAGTASFANLNIYTSYSVPYRLQVSFTNPNGQSVAIDHGSSSPFFVLPARLTMTGSTFVGFGQTLLTVTTNQVRVNAFDFSLIGNSFVSAKFYSGPVVLAASVPVVPVLKPSYNFTNGVLIVSLTPVTALGEFTLDAFTTVSQVSPGIGNLTVSTRALGTTGRFFRFNLARQSGR
jgi:hypothetical protein